LILACNDGSIQKWNAEGPFNRALARIDDAHIPQTDVSSIQISRDRFTFATRGVDNTLKCTTLSLSPHIIHTCISSSLHRIYSIFYSITTKLNVLILLEWFLVWDLRKFKEPIKVFTDLPNKYPEADIVFSPDENLIVVGNQYRYIYFSFSIIEIRVSKENETKWLLSVVCCFEVLLCQKNKNRNRSVISYSLIDKKWKS
jgi:WD40 repeat protein